MADHVHFIGIGGVGMSGIARVLHDRGCVVSGSDNKSSATTDNLISEGMSVTIGHNPGGVNGANLVVYTAAVKDDNPELQAAREKGVQTLSRAEMLGKLMEPYSHRVAITGTHGKTTTTGMVSLVLTEASLDPTVLIGGDLPSLGGNIRIGQSSLIVTEACEAFESFLNLYPSMTVITNIDADHLDHYGTFERIQESFAKFVGQLDADGVVIACMDDENVRRVLDGTDRRVVWYSLEAEAEIQAVDIDLDSPEASYDLVYKGKNLGRITLGVPGAQNVANSLGAAGVGLELGASFESIQAALAMFHGTGRRFEMLGTYDDVMVIDDYAHHPREIAATLEAARRGWNRRIVAIFQPHLYSRTKFFAEDFAKSLSIADVVVVTDIYAAREKPMEGVTATLISDKISGPEVYYIPDKAEIAGFLNSNVRAGDMVITLGAGDIRTVGEEFVRSKSGK